MSSLIVLLTASILALDRWCPQPLRWCGSVTGYSSAGRETQEFCTAVPSKLAVYSGRQQFRLARLERQPMVFFLQAGVVEPWVHFREEVKRRLRFSESFSGRFSSA